MEKFEKYKDFSKSIRKNIIFMGKHGGSNSAHIGGALSLADIFSVLFSDFFKIKKGSTDNDKIILSKGHACLALYSILFENNIISEDDMKSFEKPGSNLLGHPVKNKEISIDFSTGSLGMGLGLGIGLAYALKKKNIQRKIFVVLGDGECNEGSVWEALMLAPKLELDNLCAIVDMNGFQQTGSTNDILTNNNLVEKMSSFGWNLSSIDGHSYVEIYQALEKNFNNNLPRLIIAKTIKGKGVSKFENNNDWHHSALSEKIYEESLKELE